MRNIHSERVEALRTLMRSRGWDAVVLTGSDPHASEYPALRWKQVEWLSGFTGEAGDVVVTLDHAGLWTDTRYFIQALRQLDGSGIELHKMRVPEQVPIPRWLASWDFDIDDRCPVVAVDGLCQRTEEIDAIVDAFGGRVTIADIPDLMDVLWKDRPQLPCTPIVTLADELAGESRRSKIDWLRGFLRTHGCDSILLTALDEIAWTLNVRASDVQYNPVVLSYLLVTDDCVNWYVRKNAFTRADGDTEASFRELRGDGVNILDYADISLALSGLDSPELGRIYIDPSTLNYNLYNVLSSGENAVLVEGASPVPLRKAVKNRVEIEGMRKAHLEDGLAMERFLYWLENELEAGFTVDEWQASAKLDEFMEKIPGYRGNSFETISAYGANAALPHYHTPEYGSAELQSRGLYLVDSGRQYLYGTTDITRTIALGPCTRLEREDYTLVLKGHIDLAMAVFPRGTAGCQIDVLAREPLWKCKRNFGHGTGHGIGFYLCAHEGPQDIRQNFNPQPLLPGMITSDEPGIYREGRHGIRHENLILCRPAGSNEFADWLEFETLTLCHFDTAPIIPELLTKEERQWLNDYNESVYNTLSPKLPRQIAEWLREKTKALPERDAAS